MKKLFFILSVLLSLQGLTQQKIDIYPGHPAAAVVLINGVAYSPNNLVYHQYQHGTRNNAWGSAQFVRGSGTNKKFDYFYSSALFHGGQANSRWATFNIDGIRLSDTQVWAHPDSSRRDFGGGYFLDADGNTVYIVTYVTHDMTVANPPSVLWGLAGLGFYRYVFDPNGDLISFTDHPNEMPNGGELDYANFGNVVQNPYTHRLWHMAYGTSGTGRGILMYSDDYGITWTLKGTFGFISSDSEGALCYLGGTTNGTTILGYFVRNDISKLDFWRSSDGGGTFPFYEQVNWTSAKAVAPMVFTRPDNGHIVVTYTDRASQNYLIRGAEYDRDLLATGGEGVTTSARITYRTFAESFINSHPAESSNLPANFGYSSVAFIDSTHAWELHYDQSPYQLQPWSTAFDTVQTDMVLVPYQNEVRVKARQVVSTLTMPNGTNPLTLDDVAVDNYGTWNSYYFISPVSATYNVNVNFPISNGDGGTKTLQVYRNSTEVYSYTEDDGSGSAVGKLQGGFSTYVAKYDTLKFYVTVSGAATSPVINGLSTPTTGLAYTVDITNATLKSNTLNVLYQPQTFSNGVATKIIGTATLGSSYWSNGDFTIPETGWYKIRFHEIFPSGGGGRRVLQALNYDSEGNSKTLLQVEDKGRGGSTTTTDVTFFYRLNQGETVKFWGTIYGTTLTSSSGSFNSIEISKQ